MRKNLYLIIVLAATAHAHAMQDNESIKQSAQKGDAEAMWVLAMKCLDAENVKDGQKWKNRYTIRTRQDASCSKDRSVIAALDVVTVFSLRNFSPEIVKKNEQIFPTEEALTQRFLKDLKWVEKRTPDALPNPTWIAKYGMGGPFFGESLNQIFIKMSKCNQKRKDILQEYYKALK